MIDLIIIQLITISTNQSTVTIWAIIASVAAVISAFSAFKSRGYARRSYELAQRNYLDKQANFGLYLIDSYRWISKEFPKNKFLLFHITINNKSDSKSSFKAELEIEFIKIDKSVIKVIIAHNEENHNQIPHQKLFFSNDIRIDERGMLSKWLIFKQPTSILGEYRIEKYCIKISDTKGNIVTTDSLIIKELSHE